MPQASNQSLGGAIWAVLFDRSDTPISQQKLYTLLSLEVFSLPEASCPYNGISRRLDLVHPVYSVCQLTVHNMAAAAAKVQWWSLHKSGYVENAEILSRIDNERLMVHQFPVDTPIPHIRY